MITVCLVITNYDINGQNNENGEKRVVRLSFLMKGRVIMNLVIAEKLFKELENGTYGK